MDNKNLKELLGKAASSLEAQLSKVASLEAEIKALTEEKEKMATKLASYDRKDRCEEIVNTMIQKGLLSHSDFQSEVKKMASSKDDLDVLTKAAEMMTIKEATLDYVGDGDSTKGMTADEIAEQRFATMRR